MWSDLRWRVGVEGELWVAVGADCDYASTSPPPRCRFPSPVMGPWRVGACKRVLRSDEGFEHLLGIVPPAFALIDRSAAVGRAGGVGGVMGAAALAWGDDMSASRAGIAAHHAALAKRIGTQLSGRVRPG